MSDYNSGYTGDRIVQLLDMIPNLAKADLSNAMTVSLGQNGYAKFNNGLLIQWGYSNTSGPSKYIYFPISFYNTNYGIAFSITGGTATITSLSIIITDYYSSYFRIRGTMGDSTSTHNNPFFWIAVGRWK